MTAILGVIKKEVFFLVTAIALFSLLLGGLRYYQNSNEEERRHEADRYHLGSLRDIEIIKSELFALLSLAQSGAYRRSHDDNRTIGAAQIIEHSFQRIVFLQDLYANPAFAATLTRAGMWRQKTLAHLKDKDLTRDQTVPKSSHDIATFFHTLEQLEKLHTITYKQHQNALSDLRSANTKNFLALFGLILVLGGILIYRMLKRLRDSLKSQNDTERALTQLNEELEGRVKERSNALLKAQGNLIRSERLATIGQLTATVSHELRNPLGTIQSSFYIVQSAINTDKPQTLRATERIHRNIARCVRIIEELLDYTRVHDPQPRPVEMNAWCDAVLDEISIPQHVRIRTDYLSETTVDIDPDRMHQVLSNLLQNAHQAAEARFSEEDGGIVTISTRRSGDRFWITVSDNGPGVPEDIQGQIFDPLYSTKTYGVGLGLPLVKQVIEDHHGVVSLLNAEEGGAAFRIDLPIKQPKPGEAAA
ncbi:MAG: GHKL domain-containing protein [Rhodospirillaceae bacterium]|jgi:signal transduction histidine kinase|nr:GHKL domain-containing protein [Rhodospirillaceae bacterium]MBT5812718.1 GHKL domain-containing protein [Rhodospirillaceae bacterium]